MIGAYEFTTNTPVRLDDNHCQVVQDVALLRSSPPLSPFIKGTTNSEIVTERCVIVQRNNEGYGFTVTGVIPFYVDTVKKSGPAYCAGVREGDQILKVNGMPVSKSNQLDVIRMISGGQNVVLTLLGKTPNCALLNTSELAESSINVGSHLTKIADSVIGEEDNRIEPGQLQHKRFDPVKQLGEYSEMSDRIWTEKHNLDPFSNLSSLKAHPAYLSVFVKYLISKKNPSSLFYYLITDAYQNIDGSNRDVRRWAFEIFTTFIVPNSPLCFPNIDQNIIQPIDKILALTMEQITDSDIILLKRSFVPGRQRAVQNINEDLQAFKDVRQAELDLTMDANQLTLLLRDSSVDSQIGEQILMHLLENMITTDLETANTKHLSIVASLATCIRLIFGKASTTAWDKLLDRCSQFLYKEKSGKIKKPLGNTRTKVQIKGHVFQMHTVNTVHYCYHCRDVIWGMQPWIYFCTNCDVKIHLACSTSLTDSCYPASQKNKTAKQSRKPGTITKSDLSESDLRVDSSRTTIPEQSTISEKNIVSRSQSVRGLAISSTKQVPDRCKREQSWWGADLLPADVNDSDEMDTGSEPRGAIEVMKMPMDLESVSSSLSHTSTTDIEFRKIVKRMLEDNDLDMLVESETPPLEVLLGWDVVKLLKPKEKKRQDFINELFHTERTHLRNLKILWKVFYRPMTSQNIISAELARLLFSNLEEVIQIHTSINEKMMEAVNLFKRDHNLNGLYGSVGSLLESIFDGDHGERLTQITSVFCQHQQHALQLLRSKLENKKDREEKLIRFLMVAESFSICRKLQLRDMLPVEMQRLVKYPLLLEGIAKYTQEPSDESDSIQNSIKASKKVLMAVNTAKRNAENLRRLQELQSRVDTTPFDKEFGSHDYSYLDLSKHQLVHEGPLSCRFNRGKITELHVVLLETMLVMMTRHSDGNKLLLKFLEPSKETKWSPILPLAPLIAKEKANDKRSFFLIHNSQFGAQIFELVAPTATERKTWFRILSEQIEQDKKNRLLTGDQYLFDFGVRTAHMDDSEKVHVLTHPQLVNASEIIVHQPTALEHAEPVMTISEKLKRSDEVIFQALFSKQMILSQMLPGEQRGKVEELEKIIDQMSGLCVADLKQKNARELAMLAIVHGNRLLDSINNGINQYKKRCGENFASQPDEPSVSCSELTAIAAPLMNHLKALMQTVQDQQKEITTIKQQLHHYKEIADKRTNDRSISEETLIDFNQTG
ncbi:unnamed protein product [Auanema sp. JU1783]|nr:unnamed protein product [Auanema sp. JU1783]